MSSTSKLEQSDNILPSDPHAQLSSPRPMESEFYIGKTNPSNNDIANIARNPSGFDVISPSKEGEIPFSPFKKNTSLFGAPSNSQLMHTVKPFVRLQFSGNNARPMLPTCNNKRVASQEYAVANTCGDHTNRIQVTPYRNQFIRDNREIKHGNMGNLRTNTVHCIQMNPANDYGLRSGYIAPSLPRGIVQYNQGFNNLYNDGFRYNKSNLDSARSPDQMGNRFRSPLSNNSNTTLTVPMELYSQLAKSCDLCLDDIESYHDNKIPKRMCTKHDGRNHSIGIDIDARGEGLVCSRQRYRRPDTREVMRILKAYSKESRIGNDRQPTRSPSMSRVEYPMPDFQLPSDMFRYLFQANKQPINHLSCSVVNRPKAANARYRKESKLYSESRYEFSDCDRTESILSVPIEKEVPRYNGSGEYRRNIPDASPIAANVLDPVDDDMDMLLDSMLSGHDSVVELQHSRLQKFNEIKIYIANKNVNTALLVAREMNDLSVMKDLVELILDVPSLWSLEMFHDVSNQFVAFTSSKFEYYVLTGIKCICTMLGIYGDMIKSSIFNKRQGMVDIVRDERDEKCRYIHENIMAARAMMGINLSSEATKKIVDNIKQFDMLIALFEVNPEQ